MFGVQADYYFQSDLFIEAGLSYQNKRALIAKNVPDTRGVLIDLNGNGILDDNETLNFDNIVYNDISYSYSIISFPITLNYRIEHVNGIGLIASAGVCFNYIYKNTVLEKSDRFGEVEGVRVSINDFTTSAVLGIAIEQPLTSDITVTAGPKYFFDFYNSAKYSNIRFHSIGFEVKAQYKL